MTTVIRGARLAFVVVLFALSFVLHKVAGIRSIDCYECADVRHKSECHSIAQCSGTTPFCFITKTSGGNLTLGCDNGTTSQCKSYMTTLAPPPTTPTSTIATTTVTVASTTLNKSPITTTIPKPSTNISSTAIASTVPSTKVNNTGTGTLGGGMPAGLVGRSLYMDDAPTDERTLCCDTDTCNKRILPVFDNECLDAQDGCQDLDDKFHICDTPTEAHKICKHTCKLCNYTDGAWSNWTSWSRCDVTCGNGTQFRSRACDSPEPRDGGLNCTGDAREDRECMENECPKNSDKTYACDNPAPRDGGLNCTGGSREDRECMENDCPKDGNWADWTSWSECSATCGIGLRRRDRNCTDPIPDPDGLFCLGDSRDDEICMANVTCGEGAVLSGQWENWSGWGPCSITCGVGLKTRTRNCTEMLCLGDSQQSDICYGDQMYCTERNWTDWSVWSECSSSCGVGMRTRDRYCNNDTALFAMPCVGESREFELCDTQRCTDQESAFFASGAPTEGSTNGTVVFSDVITNVGGDYDNMTGIFTCRISGLYSFFVSIEKQSNVAQAYCHLLQNESSVFIVRVQSSSFGGIGTLQQATNSAVLELKSGDTVQLGVCSLPSTMTEFCTFSGNIISLN